MDTRHARFPFLDGARAAVDGLDVDLGELVRDSRATVERARDRVESAVTEGDVGDPHPNDRTELLSYPVARVLVSLVDDPALVAAYARAEAATAAERLATGGDGTKASSDGALATDDGGGLASTDGATVTPREALAELGLGGTVAAVEDGYEVAVGTYLELATGLDDDRWRLATRSLRDGVVPVAEDELVALLREAVRERVAEGFPLGVPPGVADHLEPEVEAIREAIGDHDLPTTFPDVDRESFPPCIDALVERLRAGERLEPHSRFALMAFLASAGMHEAVLAGVFTANLPDAVADAEGVRYAIDRLAGDGDPAAYPPPTCATMQVYGDCVNRDALCDTIAHPLSYYDERLDGADPAAMAEESADGVEPPG